MMKSKEKNKPVFSYYYGKESEQFSFLCIPKILFTDKKHFGGLSNDAKILYAFLHERMSLSRKNNWIDEENRVYIIYTVEEIEENMDCSHGTAVKLLQELDNEKGIGLISKRRRGMGQPTVIYVRNFIIEDDTEEENTDSSENPEREKIPETDKTDGKNDLKESSNNVESISTNFELQEVQNLDFKKSKNYTSRSSDFRLQEVQNLDSYFSYIDKSNIDNQSIINPPPQNFSNCRESAAKQIDRIDRKTTEEAVKAQIDYEYFENIGDEEVRSMAEEIKNIIVDVMCRERAVIIDGKRISEEAAAAAYSRLTSEHILYVLGNLVNYPERIHKIDRFVTVALYNAAYTLKVSTFAGFTSSTGLKLL